MKVLHVPFCFHPDPVGGTEVYVEHLARHLAARGIECVVAAPEPGAEGRAYEHAGLRVVRYPVAPEVRDAAELYGMRCDRAAAAFERVLEAERPDLVHLHALTRGVSPAMARAARRRGIPVVFTYHTPAASCQRGSLLEGGARPCDGRLEVARCAACSLGALGVPALAGAALARAPRALGAALGRAGASGGAWTALRMPELMSARIGAFRDMAHEADAVVAVAAWVRDLLLLNGVPREKVRLSRQGVSALPEGPAPAPRAPGGPLRVAILGRLDPLKGLDLPLRALADDPGLDVRLDVYGVAQPGGGAAYAARLRGISAGDARVRFLERLPGDGVVAALRGYDLLAVPSQALETGPLVVLEAFAAGVPVVGSRLGGIAELVRDGVDGLLVPAGSPAEWGAALRRLAGDPALLERLRAGVRTPRTMADAADDMEALYRELLATDSTSTRADDRTGLPNLCPST
ncbi:MAG TPA: glycosyltransferase [Longimicrobiaceae bacterium]